MNPAPARFTVLGANGLIGSALSAFLRQSGHDVLACSRDRRLDSDRPAGHVLCCIGVTGDFRSRPAATMRAHVAAVAGALEHLRFDSFLYLSSTRLYAHADRSDESATFSVDPHDPDQLYDLSKLAGESLCLAWPHPGVRIARLSNVCDDRFASPNCLDSIVRDAIDRGVVRLRSARTSERDYVLLHEVVPLLADIARRGNARVYNVASGRNLTYAAVLDVLSSHTGCRVETDSAAPERRSRPVDVSRLRNEFGVPPGCLLEALPDLLERYRRRRGTMAGRVTA
ncbi:MAG: NAD-dependent epimerase/dehydratase family protein [Planctomycetota bacterium]|jgi:nucleoside-diphosphate-sugar epimerase